MKESSIKKFFLISWIIAILGMAAVGAMETAFLKYPENINVDSSYDTPISIKGKTVYIKKSEETYHSLLKTIMFASLAFGLLSGGFLTKLRIESEKN